MKRRIMQKIMVFLKKEAVLSVAVVAVTFFGL